MSFNSEINRKQYSGDGSSLSFSFPYKFYDVTDLDVYLVDTTTLVPTLQSFVTDYDVTGAYNPDDPDTPDLSNGGTVVFVSAPASGKTVVIVRNTPDTQDTVLTGNSSLSFLNSSCETALDKIVMMVQYIVMVIGRSIAFPDSYTGSFSLKLPLTAPTANYVLSVNSTGDGLTWAAQTGGSGGASAAPTLNGSTGSPLSVVAGTGVILTSLSYFNMAWVVGSGGAVSVTSLPSITAGTNTGQQVTIFGTSDTNTVTLKDETQLAGSKLQLNGMIILGAYSAITLVWDSAYWVEVSRR